MRAKLFLMVVPMALLTIPAAGAFNVDDHILRDDQGNIVFDVYGLPAPDLAEMLPADFSCENGSHVFTMPYPNDPTVSVSIDILCQDPTSTELPASLDATDCPGTSHSFWQGPATIPWSYTYDTTNPFGLSQSGVASAWDSANNAWDAQVSATLFGGHTFGGTGASSGTYDQYILAEFGNYGGQLRSAIGVQWAWASGGKIVHTDAGYNTRYSFALGAVSGKYDAQNIATHEMGHGYGLGHSDTSTASQCLTLYPYGYTNDISKRTLGDGDILGITQRGY